MSKKWSQSRAETMSPSYKGLVAPLRGGEIYHALQCGSPQRGHTLSLANGGVQGSNT